MAVVENEALVTPHPGSPLTDRDPNHFASWTSRGSIIVRRCRGKIPAILMAGNTSVFTKTTLAPLANNTAKPNRSNTKTHHFINNLATTMLLHGARRTLKLYFWPRRIISSARLSFLQIDSVRMESILYIGNVDGVLSPVDSEPYRSNYSSSTTEQQSVRDSSINTPPAPVFPSLLPL
jgi:hypothetical protein